MGKVRDQLDEVRFRCGSCGEVFESAPDRVDDCADEYHPWTYAAPCPTCDAEAEQDPRQRRMLKMWANATGPKTKAGRKRALDNLEGGRTRENRDRRRFNALKHGLNAEVATYFPAKPGGYDACDGCPYRDNQCLVEHRRGGPCLQRTELFFVNHLAFEQKNPEMLRERMASLQARIASIIDMMIQDIVRRGVTISSPRWYIDSESGFQIAEYTDEEGERRLLQEVQAHPLLGLLIDYLKKNGQTLTDAGMTLRQQDDDALLEGYIAGQQMDREEERELRERGTRALEVLNERLAAATDRRERDPILSEHRRLSGPDG